VHLLFGHSRNFVGELGLLDPVLDKLVKQASDGANECL